MSFTRKHFLFLVLIVLIFFVIKDHSTLRRNQIENDFQAPVKVQESDRILILAPHPDDEVLGCAGIIQKALAAHLPVKVVFLTYGDSNEWAFLVYRKRFVIVPKAVENMGLIRHQEALNAAQVLGLEASQLTFLGYPDFGTMNIWRYFWDKQKPYRSLLTRVNKVPYDNAYRPGAPYKGEEILRDLKDIIRDFKPTQIFVSHPADHNGDHQSFYLFARVALWDLAKEGINPQINPYPIHFYHWPMPRGLHPNLMLLPPTIFKDQIPWVYSPLTKQEISTKTNALMEHRSQYISSRKYLSSFVRVNELFGDFPILQLHDKNDDVQINSSPVEQSQINEELTDEQRLRFIGLEKRTVSLKDGKLYMTFILTRPLAETVNATIYAYGYRDDTPFEKMPKIRIRLGTIGYRVLDKGKLLSAKSIDVVRNLREIQVIVPLDVLGNPQRIFTSAQTSWGQFPLDWLSWRIVELLPS